MNLDEYVDVAERVQEFYKRYPEGSIQAVDPMNPYRFEIIDGNTYIVWSAFAYRSPEDPLPAQGTAWELFPGRTSYTQHSEIMIAETSAIGRALAFAGFATKRIASKQEVEAATSRKTPAKIERIEQPEQPLDDPWNTPLLAEEPKQVTNPFTQCVHGDRIKRTGNNARGPWVGWFCPQPRGSKDQCAPKFEGA